MRNLLAFILLLTIFSPLAQAADGRNTAAILGFAAGALTGWTVHDHQDAQPVVQERVITRTIYENPRPVRVVYVREGEHRWIDNRRDYRYEDRRVSQPRYVVIRGRVYLVR